MAEKKIILTEKERETLNREYRHLIDVERPDVIEKLQLARSQGDLSENADYDAARDRQAQIESRIMEIESILNNAVAAEEVTDGNKGKITIGYTVTFRDGEGVVTVKIVGNVGADPLADIPSVSNESPLGHALIGAKKGDVVRVESVEPYEITILEAVR